MAKKRKGTYGPKTKQVQNEKVNWWVFIAGGLVVALLAIISVSVRQGNRAAADSRRSADLEAQAAQQTQIASIPTEAPLEEVAEEDAASEELAAEDDGAAVSAEVASEPSCTPKDLQYDAAPEMTIDPDASYTAVMDTTAGEIRLNLRADIAPITVNSFVFLANEGFYDCVTFHRVLQDFMAQGGDPTGTGMGGPGYQFVNETVDDVTFDKSGLLAMANAGPDTNGSQFFITFEPAEFLNGGYTIFGEVADEASMDAVNQIQLRDPNVPNLPPGTLINSVTIETN